MNRLLKLVWSTLALVSVGVATAAGQYVNPLFSRIEQTIKHNEPDWTLMNAWPAPTGQSIGLRWRSDQHEVFALVILQPTLADAISLFQDDGLGALPVKTPRKSLKIGDECYIVQSGIRIAVVLRKTNILVRLGSDSTPPELMARFAAHIGSALEEFITGIDPNKAKNEELTQQLEKGELALKQGDYRSAIEAFTEAVRLQPKSAEAHFRLGTAYYESGEYKKAITSLEEAMRLKPDFFDALVKLGESYQHSGLYGKAVEVLQKAVSLRPEHIEAKTALGTAFIRAGEPEAAVTVLREVVRMAPESALVYATLGQAYRLTGKFVEALNVLAEAQRISPEDAVVHNYLGQTYESLERQTEALAAYRRALELKSDYAEAHYNLGLLHLTRGERSAAEAEYLILKNLRSDLADALQRRILSAQRD